MVPEWLSGHWRSGPPLAAPRGFFPGESSWRVRRVGQAGLDRFHGGERILPDTEAPTVNLASLLILFLCAHVGQRLLRRPNPEPPARITTHRA